VSKGYDGKTCWVHPRAGAIPGKTPSVVLTMQKLLLTGSDVFYALNDVRSDDLGATWSPITEHAETLGRRNEPDGVVVAACDFTPKWHAKSGKLLGTGHTARYKGDHVMAVRPRETAWSVYDDQKRTWTPWTTLDMPKDAKFINAGAGSVQRFDLENGDILLPIYFKAEKDKYYRTTVLRCSFDGTTLKYLEHGTELALESGRGVYEPSITRCAGKFYLTLRNDTAGYVAVSDDGLHFGPIQPWKFDDGSELGNYNTQQHWVTHRDRLYLVYNRKGAHNDHVIRHRGPLFMAEVDQKTLAVKRSDGKHPRPRARREARQLRHHRSQRKRDLGDGGGVDADAFAEHHHPAGQRLRCGQHRLGGADPVEALISRGCAAWRGGAASRCRARRE
jgi:hypothetical protein